MCYSYFFFFFSSRRRHTRFDCDWSSDVCSSDLVATGASNGVAAGAAAFVAVTGLANNTAYHWQARTVDQTSRDRKSGVEGKRVDLGGRRIIKKKKKKRVLETLIVVRK